MSKKKSVKKMIPMKRSGHILVLSLAVLILIVSSVTMSYSWFKPDSKIGNSMNYSAGILVRSENCVITSSTAAETENNLPMEQKTGELVYSTSEIASAVTVPSNQIYYFKTVITNNSEYATNVSLYIKSLPAPGSNSSNSYGLGVAIPTNTYRVYSGTESFTDVCIVRNAYIGGKSGSNPKNTLTVEWFIKTGGSSVTLNPYSRTESNGALYLSYN